MKRQPIRGVSKARAREQRIRVAALRRVDADRERCQWPQGCDQLAVDAHEILPRSRGGDPTDLDGIALLCRRHHDRVGTHPVEARELGVLR